MDAITLLSAGVMLGTAHVAASEGLDSRTPGVYVRVAVGRDPWFGAVLRNSYGRASVLVAKEIPLGRVSVFAGAVTGYGLAPVLPVVGLAGLAGPVRVTASAGYRSVAVSVGMEWRL